MDERQKNVAPTMKRKVSGVFPYAAIASVAAVWLLIHAGILWNVPRFSTGIFEAAVSMLTLIALVVGGYGAFVSHQTGLETLDQARISDLAQRFQKGVELLESDRASSIVGALTILAETANELPEKYTQPMADTLAAFVSERSATVRAVVTRATGLPSTPIEILKAITVISHVPNAMRWPRNPFGAAVPVSIVGAFLNDATMRGMNFRLINFIGAHVGDVNFIEGDFISATFDAKLSGRLVFRRCRFRDFRIYTGVDEGPEAGSEMLLVQFVECSVESSTINGRPIPQTGIFPP